MEYRFYRTAKHPEFMAYEIEPALVMHELPISLAPTVAGLLDSSGGTIEYVIDLLKQAMVIKPR